MRLLTVINDMYAGDQYTFVLILNKRHYLYDYKRPRQQALSSYLQLAKRTVQHHHHQQKTDYGQNKISVLYNLIRRMIINQAGYLHYHPSRRCGDAFNSISTMNLYYSSNSLYFTLLYLRKRFFYSQSMKVMVPILFQ